MTDHRSTARDANLPDAYEHRLAVLEARLTEIHGLVTETHKLTAVTHRQVTATPTVFNGRTRFSEEGWRFWILNLLLPALFAIVLISGTAYVVKTFS